MHKVKHTVNPVLLWVVVAAAALAAAAAVVLDAPIGLRLIASAVLLLVPGIGLAQLLLPRGDVRGSDGAIAIPLSMLLGVLSWLGAAMALNAFGVALRPATITLTLTGVGLIVAALAIARSASGQSPLTTVRTRVSRHYRTAAAVVATGALLGGATALAVDLIPTPTASYTTIGFVDDSPFGASAPAATAGSMVRLNWVVRGFGHELSPTLTSVRLDVDGVPVDDVAVDVSPDTTPDTKDASSTISGAVTFSAPMQQGRHTVNLFVAPTTRDGSDVPTPGYVSTPLEVNQ